MPTSTTSLIPMPGIYIDGLLHPSLTQDLVAFTVEDAVSSSARCTARFLNVGSRRGQGVDYKYFGLDDFNFGRRLSVWQGMPPDLLYRLFEGRIYLIEGAFDAGAPPEVLVQAEDALQGFRMRQRTRIFEDMTDAQMIQQVAAEHGLAPDIQMGSVQTVHGHVAQLNQSDYAFLLDRVMAAGAEMWIDQNTLVVSDQAVQGTPGTLVYGGDLVSFDVRADLRRQATSVGVSGWDFRARQAIARGASDNDLPPGGSGARSGGRVLEEAFGQRLDTVVDAAPGNDADAKSLAVAYHRTQSAEFVTGQGIAVNAAGMRAGRRIDLQGLGPLFSGAYQITRVRHVFDRQRGLRAEFDVRRARIGRNVNDTKAREAADADRDPRVASDPGARPDIPAPAGGPRTKGRRAKGT